MDISNDPLFNDLNNISSTVNQSLERLWLTHEMDTKFAVNAIIDKTADVFKAMLFNITSIEGFDRVFKSL